MLQSENHRVEPEVYPSFLSCPPPVPWPSPGSAREQGGERGAASTEGSQQRGLSRRLMLEETEWVGSHGGKERGGREGKGRRKGRRKGKRQRGKWRGARPPGVGWGGAKRQHFLEGHPSLHPRPVHIGCWWGTLETYLCGLPAPAWASGPQPSVPPHPRPATGTCSCWGGASSPGVTPVVIPSTCTAAAEGL